MNAASPSRLKIAYITASDPRNKHSWSGTDHYLMQSLQRNIGDVVPLQPPPPSALIFFLKAFHGISMKLFGKRFDWRHSRALSKAYGKRLTQQLRNRSFGLIVAPASDALIAHLETNIPIVYINDRTIAGALNYHKMLSGLWKFSEEQSMETDKLAIRKSIFVSYPSEWAVESAVRLYGTERKKILLNYFGANMDDVPPASIAENREPGKICRLLFIGVNWTDKGGPVAVSCLEALLAMGIDAELTVCGSTPPAEVMHPKMNVYPFLNKNKPEEFEILRNLWINSTFLILPTRIDAYGIVFCEAAAYGLPSLGSDTGGVSGALHAGKNGYLMPAQADGKAYAEKIASVLSNPPTYRQLAKNARKEFEEELNWDTWAQRFAERLDATLPGISQ